MGRVRVRWSAAGKVALLALAALLVARLAPALLKPPEPPPLAADVGLPRVTVEPKVEPERRVPHPPRGRKRVHHRPSPSSQRGKLGARVGSKPRPRPREKAAERPAPPASPPAVTTPPPAPEPPPPPPVPAPTSAPVPAPPAPPGDGSAEFAPH